jgi:hypothetical protein
MIWFARILMEGEQMTNLHANDPAIRRLLVCEAIEYMATKHGVRVTESALAQHRSKRTGPAYTVILRRIYYSPDAIDQWIAKKVADSSKSQRQADQAQL